MSDSGFIPYGRQWIDDGDVEAVSAVLRGDWLTTGPSVEAFERCIAERVGARFAVACSSATAGLHLACLAAGLGPGDVAVVPSVTFMATANAARYTGADVGFADVDPDTALLTPAHLESAVRLSRGAKAALPVHMAGQCADMTGIHRVAKQAGLIVIEDAAHAIGSEYLAGNEWIRVGACAHSDMTVFSFHPVKTVTMGEGGCVTTNDPALAERLVRLRSHGITRDPAAFQLPEQATENGRVNPWYGEITELGFNYRATDMQCALGSSQMAKLDRFIARRADIVARYDAAFAPLRPILTPLARRQGVRTGWHLYVALIDFEQCGRTRAEVMSELAARGVGSQVHYLPVHRQPYYRALYPGLNLAGADNYYRRCLSLPLFPAMTDDEVERVILAVRSIVGR